MHSITAIVLYLANFGFCSLRASVRMPFPVGMYSMFVDMSTVIAKVVLPVDHNVERTHLHPQGHL